MTQAVNPVLVLDDLHVALPPGGDREFAVERVSLRIDQGRTLCIVGESGSGKSVMALTAMGLLPSELKIKKGSIRLDGADMTSVSQAAWRTVRGRIVGMVFQEPMTALNPVMRCGDQIDELLRAHTDWSPLQRRETTLSSLGRVGIAEPRRIYDSYPHQLSGGQRQRIVIAMAVVLKPSLLICDEPTTALDVTTQKEILKLIAELKAEIGTAVLFITHDMGVVAEIADDVMVMRLGQMIEYGPSRQVLEHPKEEYTRLLLAAVPGMKPPPAREASGGPVLLDARSVGKVYGSRNWFGRRRDVSALRDASLKLLSGQTIGVVGESGSGKSTFARCLVRLIEPTCGEVLWADAEVDVAHMPERKLRQLRSHVQIIFQDPNRSLNPRQRVGEAIVEAAMNFGAGRDEAKELAQKLMRQVRLPVEALSRYPSQFSGGQRQRLAIARALACKPKVLIADEAVSALDVSVQAQVLDLLREVQAQYGVGILFITHDLRVAAQLCDRIVVMRSGAILEEGRTGQVFESPSHPYTRNLLEAAPTLPWQAAPAVAPPSVIF